MRKLDDILRSPDWKPDVQWALNVYSALSMHLSLRHDEDKYFPELTPSQVVLDDSFDENGKLHVLPLTGDLEDEYTICYMAPERSSNPANASSDIFSATAIFYRLLTGHAPWHSVCEQVKSPRQRQIVLKWERQTNMPDMSGLPKVLQDMLRRGMALNPQDRFRYAIDIYETIDLMTNDELEIQAAPEPAARSKVEPQKVTSSAGIPASNTTFAFRKGNGNGFKDIAGMTDIKNMLSDDVLFVLRNREQAKRYRLDTLNGLLLYGPPGCGKTYLAEKFAEEAGTNFIIVNASDLGSPYIHGTQEKIAQLFNQAKQNAPAVVCLDEFDAMVPDRSSRSGEQTANEVNEFLTHLNNCSKDGIFVIALTNRPDKIDPAVLRSGRLDKMVYVPLPDSDTRKEIFHIHLQGRPYEADNLDWNKLSAMSDGLVSSDIALVVNEAARKAARENKLITEEMLEDSLHHISPSVKSDMVRYYNRMRQQMEQGKDARPLIGFR